MRFYFFADNKKQLVECVLALIFALFFPNSNPDPLHLHRPRVPRLDCDDDNGFADRRFGGFNPLRLFGKKSSHTESVFIFSEKMPTGFPEIYTHKIVYWFVSLT